MARKRTVKSKRAAVRNRLHAVNRRTWMKGSKGKTPQARVGRRKFI